MITQETALKMLEALRRSTPILAAYANDLSEDGADTAAEVAADVASAGVLAITQAEGELDQ